MLVIEMVVVMDGVAVGATVAVMVAVMVVAGAMAMAAETAMAGAMAAEAETAMAGTMAAEAETAMAGTMATVMDGAMAAVMAARAPLETLVECNNNKNNNNNKALNAYKERVMEITFTVGAKVPTDLDAEALVDGLGSDIRLGIEVSVKDSDTWITYWSSFEYKRSSYSEGRETWEYRGALRGFLCQNLLPSTIGVNLRECQIISAIGTRGEFHGFEALREYRAARGVYREKMETATRAPLQAESLAAISAVFAEGDKDGISEILSVIRYRQWQEDDTHAEGLLTILENRHLAVIGEHATERLQQYLAPER